MDKTQPARVAPEHQAEINAMTADAEARRSAATAGSLQWGQPDGCDLPTPAAFGHVEHAQGLQPFFTAQQMREYVAADRALRPAGDAAMPVIAWLHDWRIEGPQEVVKDWVCQDYDEAHDERAGCHNIRPLVKQADAQAALKKQAVEIFALNEMLTSRERDLADAQAALAAKDAELDALARAGRTAIALLGDDADRFRAEIAALKAERDRALLDVARLAAEKVSQRLALSDLVNRFLSWPLPEAVCADKCASIPGYPHRSGTSLLNADEARQMLEHVLAVQP